MPTFTSLDTGTNVAFLTAAAAARKLGTSLTPTTSGGTTYNERFVVFGLGKFATVCGDTIDEAPVWFNPSPNQDPDHVYARFGLVFQTADSTGAAMTRAKLVGVVEFAQWGTMTKDDNLSYYYSLK